MASIDLKDLAPTAEDRALLRKSFLGSLMGKAAALVGLLIFWVGGMLVLFGFRDRFVEGKLWFEATFGPAVGGPLFWAAITAPVWLLLLFDTLPAGLKLWRERHLLDRAIETASTRARFRLAPYGPADAESFERLDGATDEVLGWIETAGESVLYLAGDSGVGKSSLAAACVAPGLEGKGWVVLQARSYGDALGRLTTDLRARKDLFGRTPPAEATLRELLESAAERRARAGAKPILVIVDQFEEFLILYEAARAGPFAALVEALAAAPAPGLKLMLVYRSDYETEIFKLRLPAPIPGRNAFKLGRYNRAEAEAFLRAGGRLPSDAARGPLFAGLDRIEETPGLYRQITLNMVGLFLERMGERLTADPERLIQGYLDLAIREGGAVAAAERGRVLDALVSDAGTKGPRTEAEIVAATGLPLHVVRATLHGLAEKGLVRALEGAEPRWEISHDFLAALLGRAVGRVGTPLLARARWLVGPAAVAGWLVVMGLGVPWWQQRAEAQARGIVEAAEGSIHARSAGSGLEVRFDTERLADCTKPVPDWSKVFSSLGQIPGIREIRFTGQPGRYATCRSPVMAMHWADIERLPRLAALDLSGTRINSFKGMPTLSELSRLNLSFTSIATFEGMPALAGLSSLVLSGTAIASFEGMPVLTGLSSLDLSITPIASFEGMPVLAGLSSLDLSYTSIAGFQGMPVLAALSSLNLSNTPIASFEGMPVLAGLSSLYLSDTSVAGFRGMPALPGLNSLDLSFASIASLEGMPALAGLRSLTLAGTPIDSFIGMPTLVSLRSLEVSFTSIPSFEGMPALAELRSLDLVSTPLGEGLAAGAGLPDYLKSVEVLF